MKMIGSFLEPGEAPQYPVLIAVMYDEKYGYYIRVSGPEDLNLNSDQSIIENDDVSTDINIDTLPDTTEDGAKALFAWMLENRNKGILNTTYPWKMDRRFQEELKNK